MVIKDFGPATDWTVVDEWDGGVGWMAYPDEGIQRTSHALAVDGDLWLVDPIDVPDLDDLLAEYGTVAGAVVLFPHHQRDAAAIANRHDVAVHVPDALLDRMAGMDAPVEPIGVELADTAYGLHQIVDRPWWNDWALYGEDTGALVVGESIGTAPHFLAGDERLGVHPIARWTPPRRLARLDPDRILVGHGAGIHEDGGEDVDESEGRGGSEDVGELLEDALAGARRGIPRNYVENTLAFLPWFGPSSQ